MKLTLTIYFRRLVNSDDYEFHHKGSDRGCANYKMDNKMK